jgi:hypothetical protein
MSLICRHNSLSTSHTPSMPSLPCDTMPCGFERSSAKVCSLNNWKSLPFRGREIENQRKGSKGARGKLAQRFSPSTQGFVCFDTVLSRRQVLRWLLPAMSVHAWLMLNSAFMRTAVLKLVMHRHHIFCSSIGPPLPAAIPPPQYITNTSLGRLSDSPAEQ